MQWSLLAPEIIIALLGMFVLVLGLVLPDSRKNVMGKVTLIGLVIAGIATVKIFGISEALFNGVYNIDAFGNFFKLLFLSGAIIVVLFAGTYNEKYTEKRFEFYSFFVFTILGMMVMASAGELLTMYIGLELMTISFYILTAYLSEDQLSVEAGLKYLILGAISSAVLLWGISLVYAAAGTTVISQIASLLTVNPVLIAGVLLMAAGFAFKVSAVPFHMWTPDIYQGAPTPVTAFLSVASKAAGFAAFVRVFMIALPVSGVDWNLIIAILAAATMIAGNLIALVQKDTKRLLAYSSIAQAGYILVGLVAANSYGLKGLLFYAMLYVFSNLGAFAVVSLMEVETGSSKIEALAGLGKRSPLLAAIMTVCLLSLAGIPPLAGFVGKFYLFSGVIEAGYLWLAFIGLIMSMISVYYYLNVAKVMYIGQVPDADNSITVGIPAQIALWTCFAGTVLLGVFPAPLTNLVQLAITVLF